MPEWTPKDPNFESKVRESFLRQKFMAHLGARLGTVEPGLVEIEVSFREELTQQHGYIHAGVTGSLVDSACGYAAFTLTPPGCSVLTVEYKLNLLAPATGEKLLARGKVIRAGKTLTVCEGEVFAIANGAQTLCATSLTTIIALPSRSNTAKAD